MAALAGNRWGDPGEVSRRAGEPVGLRSRVRAYGRGDRAPAGFALTRGEIESREACGPKAGGVDFREWLRKALRLGSGLGSLANRPGPKRAELRVDPAVVISRTAGSGESCPLSAWASLAV